MHNEFTHLIDYYLNIYYRESSIQNMIMYVSNSMYFFCPTYHSITEYQYFLFISYSGKQSEKHWLEHKMPFGKWINEIVTCVALFIKITIGSSSGMMCAFVLTDYSGFSNKVLHIGCFKTVQGILFYFKKSKKKTINYGYFYKKHYVLKLKQGFISVLYINWMFLHSRNVLHL